MSEPMKMLHQIVSEEWLWNVQEQRHVGVIVHHKLCAACAIGFPP